MELESVKNIATAIYEVFSNSSHEWQYCFLGRGGDGEKNYFNANELLEESLHLAEHIASKVDKEKPIIIALEHNPDLLIAILACFFAGRVAIPAPIPRFGSAALRLGVILSACERAVIISKKLHFNEIESLLRSSSTQRNDLVCIEALKSTPVTPPTMPLDGFSKSPCDTVIIQFTSGSTKEPKGVLISSTNILANQAEIAKRWLWDENKNYLTWLPLYHDMGLFGILAPILCNMKVVQMDPLHFTQKPQRWLKAISDFNVYCSGGPPFAFDLCSQIDDERLPTDIDLSNWKIAFCGADYVPASSMETFRLRFSQYGLSSESVIPVYGLAEATLYIAGQPNNYDSVPEVYDGNLTEGCYLGAYDQPSVEIHEIGGGEILEGADVGEVCFSGKSVSAGYYKMQEPRSSNLLRTGDLGFIQGDYLFIVGRLKDIIVNNGQTISPSSIELIASKSCDFLNPSAAAAFQNNYYGGDVILLIEVKGGAGQKITSQETLRSKIRSSVMEKTGVLLAEIKFLRRGELMRTTSGKVQRKRVSEKFTNGHEFRVIEDASC